MTLAVQAGAICGTCAGMPAAWHATLESIGCVCRIRTTCDDGPDPSPRAGHRCLRFCRPRAVWPAGGAGHMVIPAVRCKAGLPNEAVAGDIGSSTNWRMALSGCDAVVHLAARVHMMRDDALDSLALYREINTEATLNLARQAADVGVKRFVFLSSIKVNGEGAMPPIGKTTRQRPPTRMQFQNGRPSRACGGSPGKPGWRSSSCAATGVRSWCDSEFLAADAMGA